MWKATQRNKKIKNMKELDVEWKMRRSDIYMSRFSGDKKENEGNKAKIVGLLDYKCLLY